METPDQTPPLPQKGSNAGAIKKIGVPFIKLQLSNNMCNRSFF